ncbi:MAG: Na/Pi cotransporter family protein [Eubacteriales bacterium]
MSFIEVATLFGGIALFLYGMSAMGDGLKGLAGNKMETYLWELSSSPWRAFLLGILVTAVIQSSSATSVMAVSFVNAGMMGFSQALCIILGANIGTTMTSWILSLSGADSGAVGDILSTEMLFSVFIIIGVAMRIISKKRAQKEIGAVLVGLGTLLLAMSMISGSVEPLTTNPTFQSILTKFDNNPLLSMLAGILVAAIVQSCSAAVGILQAVSLTCAISYNACLPMILGMNIGASVPVLFSMIGASKNGKRSALVYLYSNILGMVLICLIYYPLNAIFHFEIMQQAANTSAIGIPVINTVMRIVIAAVLLPCHKLLEKLIYLSVKYDPAENADEEEIDNLSESLLNYPPAALERSRIAVDKMASLAIENVKRAMSLVGHFDRAKHGVVQDKEALVDKYEDKLGNYIVRISKNALSLTQQASVSCLLSAIGDFERLSDHAANISEVAQEIHDKKIVFSESAQKEIDTLVDAVNEILQMSYQAFVDGDIRESCRIDPLEEVIDEICKRLRVHHIERLQNSDCTILMGFVFNDLITNLERVSDHCSNIAFSVLHNHNVNAEEHDYAEHLSSTPEFQAGMAYYREKYLDRLDKSELTARRTEADAKAEPVS